MTVLIFIARAFIAGGFQAAYVYTPEVHAQTHTHIHTHTHTHTHTLCSACIHTRCTHTTLVPSI